MTREEEQYVHLVQCTDDLNEAWAILREIGRVPGVPLVGPAFKYAIVAYSRPYKASEGVSGQRYRLDASLVPPEHLDLHNRIIAARDKILAHSDLTVREARLHVAATSTGKFVGVVQNVIFGTEELANLASMIDLIEKTLKAMYERVNDLEQELSINT